MIFHTAANIIQQRMWCTCLLQFKTGKLLTSTTNSRASISFECANAHAHDSISQNYPLTQIRAAGILSSTGDDKAKAIALLSEEERLGEIEELIGAIRSDGDAACRTASHSSSLIYVFIHDANSQEWSTDAQLGLA